jgi:undecaprenyl diphosphate synthase
MKTPQCIGIIMDGNRRWAKAHALPTFEGHRHGYQTMKQVTEWAKETGVGTIIFFAFSEENWKRAQDEVAFMMDLIREVILKETKEAIEKNIRLRYIGDISKFAPDIQEGMLDAEKQTASNTGINLVLAVSYGGRQEIVHVMNELLKEGKTKNKTEVTAEDVSRHMYTAGLPDPDMIIRTSGEQRTSGFLPWQGVYSELFFTKTLWPDFSKEEFTKMLEEYNERDRRMGK